MIKQVSKSVTIIARIEFKSDKRKAVYVVRSSGGDKQYHVSFFDGVATGCDCPSYKVCKHRTHCQAVESTRSAMQLPPTKMNVAAAVATAMEKATLSSNRGFQILR